MPFQPFGKSLQAHFLWSSTGSPTCRNHPMRYHRSACSPREHPDQHDHRDNTDTRLAAVDVVATGTHSCWRRSASYPVWRSPTADLFSSATASMPWITSLQNASHRPG
jgi:hypothetical protein